MKIIGTYQPLQPPNPKSQLKVSKDFSFSLNVKGINAVLQSTKFLATKWIRTGDGISNDEVAVLHLLVQYLSENRSDELNLQKARMDTLSTKQLVKLILTFPNKKLPDWAKAQVRILVKNENTIMSPRGFLGVEKMFKLTDLVKVQRLKREKNPPPPRRIGVGYRDKGSCRDESIDGTPLWQEVGQHKSSLEDENLRERCLYHNVYRFLTPYKLRSYDS